MWPTPARPQNFVAFPKVTASFFRYFQVSLLTFRPTQSKRQSHGLSRVWALPCFLVLFPETGNQHRNWTIIWFCGVRVFGCRQRRSKEHRQKWNEKKACFDQTAKTKQDNYVGDVSKIGQFPVAKLPHDCWLTAEVFVFCLFVSFGFSADLIHFHSFQANISLLFFSTHTAEMRLFPTKSFQIQNLESSISNTKNFHEIEYS